MTIDIVTSNILGFGDLVLWSRPDGLFIEIIQSTLSLDDTMVLVEPDLGIVSHSLTFTQGLKKRLSTSLSHRVDFQQQLNQAAGHFFITDALQFSHAAKNPDWESIEEELTLTDVALATRSFTQSLVIVQTLVAAKILAITVSQDVDLAQGIIGYNENNPNIVLIDIPEFALANEITFTYLDTVLTLKRPQIGDTNKIEYAMINRRTRGGDLKIFRDNQWPKTETFTYKFDSINSSKAKEFLFFVEDSFGQDIVLEDYESFRWRGFIKNAEALITQLYREGCYSFGFDVEFEGTLIIPNEAPPEQMIWSGGGWIL